MIQSLKEKILTTRYPMLNPLYRMVYGWGKSARGIIYMLHRVCPFEQGKLSPNENMKVSPQFLEKIIIQYKKQGVEFASLDNVYGDLTEIKRIKKSYIAFTLDDGYIDNFEYAFPIFKKHNVPFTVYVTTDFPNHKSILWWYIIESLILQNDALILNSGEKLDCSDASKKNESFLTLRKMIIALPALNFEKHLCELLNNYKIDVFADVKRLAMTWDQISTMSKHPLCTIGGHSVHHLAFNKLSEEELHFEVSESLKLIENHVNYKIEHFAYPFGSANEVGQREINLMRQFSLKTVTLADGGVLCKHHQNSLTALPRILLSEYN